jgi:hypothetical protein
MFYVGLDIHTKRIAFCVLSEKGQFVQRGQVRCLEEVLRVLRDLPDRFEVCYEASCGYGHFHDLLRPLAARAAPPTTSVPVALNPSGSCFSHDTQRPSARPCRAVAPQCGQGVVDIGSSAASARRSSDSVAPA